MLSVTGLSKTFPPRSRRSAALGAVRGISFDVPDGQFFTLLGPSGCGKTTTLRMLAGLEMPSAGKITMNDQVLYSSAEGICLPAEGRNVGMVFQSYAIWPHMTVYDNAAYPLRYGRGRSAHIRVFGRRREAAEVDNAVREMLRRVGLAEASEAWATQLSGGQQQRLALARALLGGTELLLLDEPLSNLDAELRGHLRRELKDFQEGLGITTLYVTHDQGEALSLSDSIAIMREGVIEQIGSPQEIYERPANAYVARFVGHSNLLAGRVKRQSGTSVEVTCSLGTLEIGRAAATTSLDVRLLNEPCLVGIRPERMFVQATPPIARPDIIVAPATVTSIDFLGESAEYLVIVADEVIRVRDRLLPEVTKGGPAWVWFPCEAAYLLPADREEHREPVPHDDVALRRRTPMSARVTTG